MFLNIKGEMSKYLKDCFGLSGKEHLLKETNLKAFVEVCDTIEVLKTRIKLRT